MANKTMKNNNVNKESENTRTANGGGVNSTSLLSSINNKSRSIIYKIDKPKSIKLIAKTKIIRCIIPIEVIVEIPILFKIDKEISNDQN